MRRTPGVNPNGFEKYSFNYRVLQIRRALGWSQEKLHRASGISKATIWELENHIVNHPNIDTIRRIKAIERDYADIIKEYAKAPVRMCRLGKYDKSGRRVKLLPIEIRRPEDLESLGKVEADSSPLFYGRGTRRRMQQTGLPLSEKARRAKSGATRSRLMHAKNAAKRAADEADKQVQSRQPDDSKQGS